MLWRALLASRLGRYGLITGFFTGSVATSLLDGWRPDPLVLLLTLPAALLTVWLLAKSRVI